jgi:hypothetical protein
MIPIVATSGQWYKAGHEECWLGQEARYRRYIPATIGGRVNPSGSLQVEDGFCQLLSQSATSRDCNISAMYWPSHI